MKTIDKKNTNEQVASSSMNTNAVKDPTAESLGCDSILPIPGGYLFKKNGSKSFGIMTRDGKELMPCILDSYTEPSNGVLFFTSGSLHGLWHQEFGILLQPIYDNIEFVDLGEPLLFTKNGEVGYVDFDGNFVSKAEVDAIEDEDEKHDRLLEFLYVDCEY